MTDQLHLGISTAAFFPRPLPDTLDLLARLPWNAVELMPQTPHECTAAFADEVLALGAGRFHFCAIHFPQILAPFLYNPYPGALDFGRALCTGLAEQAGRLGSNTIIVHAPWPSMAAGAFYEATLVNLRHLCDVSRQHGVTIGLENTPSSQLAGSPQAMQAFAAAIDRDNLGFTVDITHAYQLKQDPLAYLQSLPSIAHLHVSDFGLDTRQPHVLPGRGVVDWPTLIAALKERQFRGNFILELLPETLDADPGPGLAESIAMLDRCFAAVGIATA
jgi:sugar phosphate isomerase/epimerase